MSDLVWLAQRWKRVDQTNKKVYPKKFKAMKNVIAIAAFAGTALFASCRSYDPNDADVVRSEGAASGTAAQTAQEATIDSLKLELAKQRIVDSMNEVARLDKETTVAARSSVARTASAPRVRTSTRTRRASSSNYSNNSYAGSGAAGNSYSQPAPVTQTVYEPAPAPVQQRRGWSAKAKGAVIGAGTGAVSGAVINKRDRVKGAIIGGVLGAGVGTGVGAILDRKNGR